MGQKVSFFRIFFLKSLISSNPIPEILCVAGALPAAARRWVALPATPAHQLHPHRRQEGGAGWTVAGMRAAVEPLWRARGSAGGYNELFYF